MTSPSRVAEMCPREPKRVAKQLKRAVFGVPDMADAAALLRSLGWEVETATGGDAIRRALREFEASAVVLGVSAGDESGWLTCAKIARARPHVRVVLIGPEDEETERFALFAGAAAYVPGDRPTAEIARAVTG